MFLAVVLVGVYWISNDDRYMYSLCHLIIDRVSFSSANLTFSFLIPSKSRSVLLLINWSLSQFLYFPQRFLSTAASSSPKCILLVSQWYTTRLSTQIPSIRAYSANPSSNPGELASIQVCSSLSN